MKSKRTRTVLSLLAICAVFICGFSIYKKYTYTATKEDVTIAESWYNPANRMQYHSCIKLFTWNDQLYFYHYNEKIQYYRELCVLEDGTVRSLGKFPLIYALENGYLYYEDGKEPSYLLQEILVSPSSFPDKIPIMCLNLRNNQHTHLADVAIFSPDDIFYEEDGTFYVPDNCSRNGRYYTVKDDTISEASPIAERYPLGSSEYAIEDSTLVRYTADGQREVIVEKMWYMYSQHLIPCREGLLIYYPDTPWLLRYIDARTETVTELFDIHAFANTSAVNVYGDWVYVSYKRYRYHEHSDLFGLSPYRVDSESGTYRISLKDLSKEKISDQCYTGLYIFDDSGIYACDIKGGVHKLDFDGNVIATILK